MIDSKATPGPWKISEYNNSEEFDVQTAGVRKKDCKNGMFIIARTFGPDAKANANIIKVSPQMYEILESFVVNRNVIKADYPFDGPLKKLLDKAEQVIKDSRGENEQRE